MHTKRRYRTLTQIIIAINPVDVTYLFRYPLKTSENQRFSDVFRGYQKRSVASNGLKFSPGTKSATANKFSTKHKKRCCDHQDKIKTIR